MTRTVNDVLKVIEGDGFVSWKEIQNMRAEILALRAERDALRAATDTLRQLPLTKFDGGAVNILRLIKKGTDDHGGWAPTSGVIWNGLVQHIPETLVEAKERDDGQDGKMCRLTLAGSVAYDILTCKSGFFKFPEPKRAAVIARAREAAP